MTEKSSPQPAQGCQHKRYSLDKQEQVGHCLDCGAEGRMAFVVPAPEGGPDLRAAAQQAADALEKIARHFGIRRLGESTLADSTARSEAHAAIEALRAALAAQPQAAPVPDLYARLAEAHDASLDDDHRACRAILTECMGLLAHPQPSPAEPEWRCPETGRTCTAEDCGRECAQRPAAAAPAEGDAPGEFDWLDLPGAVAAWNRIRRAARALSPTGSIAETLNAAAALADLAFKVQPKGAPVAWLYEVDGRRVVTLVDQEPVNAAQSSLPPAIPLYAPAPGQTLSYHCEACGHDFSHASEDDSCPKCGSEDFSAAQAPAPAAGRYVVEISGTGAAKYWPLSDEQALVLAQATAVGADDAKDAARYRWLREQARTARDEEREMWSSGSELDEDIDAAMAAALTPVQGSES